MAFLMALYTSRLSEQQVTQPAFDSSKLTMGTLEQDVKYVQS